MHLIFKRYFLRKAHSHEQTTFMWVLPSGTCKSAESTVAMQIASCSGIQHIGTVEG